MKILKNLGFVLAACLVLSCSDDDSGTVTPPDDDQEQPVDPEEPEEPVNPGDDVPEHDFLMGAIYSFQKDLRNGVNAASGGTASTTYYNLPLFEVKEFGATEEEWWDNLVEEFVYSGLDYVAANCRGRLPKADTESRYYPDHGDPTRIKDLLAALKRRGEENLKVCVFDDCPASWAAARNLDLYGSYTSRFSAEQQDKMGLTDVEVMYPIDDLEEIYKYIWDYNIKLAFENFYGENQENNKYLFRYQGRPVLYLWSVNGFLNVDYAALGNKKPDCTGKLKAIIEKLRADFNATFGEDVFICVDKAFCDRDMYCDATVIDARNGWFVASEQTTNRYSYSLLGYNNVNVGVACPGFLTNDKSGTRMFFDSEHGKRLTDALDYMVRYEADLVLLEGFTDMAENAAYWRSSDTKFYDFPNQRMNIIRKYSSTQAYPKEMRVEAEACDTYEDQTPGNSGNAYRKGDLDVKKCTDGYNGWCVTDTQEGESLRWVELPFSAGQSVIKLRYASQEDGQVRFDIDGEPGTTVDLPATGGSWAEVDAATVSFEEKGWREVVLNIVSGNVDLNCFTIVAQ